MKHQNFKNKFKVYNVPFYLKPFYWLYGYGLGIIVFLFIVALRSTLKVEFIGKENLSKSANNIYCFWHQDLIGFYLTFKNHKGFDVINHPSWYMKPIHVLIKSYGVSKIYYGSTGNKGLEAAKALTESLKTGKSTYITPDGPYGPLHQLNKGVLHLSKDGNIPILAIRFDYSNYKKQKGWDSKRMPLPFSTIKVHVSEPIYVTKENFLESEDFVKKELLV